MSPSVLPPTTTLPTSRRYYTRTPRLGGVGPARSGLHGQALSFSARRHTPIPERDVPKTFKATREPVRKSARTLRTTARTPTSWHAMVGKQPGPDLGRTSTL